jgi:hypothetical protein
VRIIEAAERFAEQRSVGANLAIALFRALDRREDDFIPPWVIRSFDEEYDFFVSRAHLGRELDQVPADAGLKDHFEAFERSFHSVVGPYFSGKEELDAILQDTNTAAD